MNSTQKVFSWIRILSTLGILVSLYVLWEQISRTPFQVCDISSTVNCNAIISGPVAQTLGIPTPLYGLVGYIVILLAAMFSWKKTMLVVATLGLAFCLWIGYVELFLLHVVCPVCITCDVIIISVFVLSLFAQRNVSEHTA